MLGLNPPPGFEKKPSLKYLLNNYCSAFAKFQNNSLQDSDLTAGNKASRFRMQSH